MYKNVTSLFSDKSNETLIFDREQENQYSISKIILIWFLAVSPITFLGWIIGPIIASLLPVDDLLKVGVARTIVMLIGLFWLFILSMIIVYKEEGDLYWSTLKKRLWLQKPMDLKSGREGGRIWLWFIPFAIVLFLIETTFAEIQPFLDKITFFKINPALDGSRTLSNPAAQAKLLGAWWFFILFVVMLLFNTFLGEEFLFRGVLLPKMKGIFGKYDWVANGILFGIYHLAQPWSIPNAIVSSIFVFSLSAKKFRSTWMAIALHSVQSVIFSILILVIVLGLV